MLYNNVYQAMMMTGGVRQVKLHFEKLFFNSKCFDKMTSVHHQFELIVYDIHSKWALCCSCATGRMVRPCQ